MAFGARRMIPAAGTAALLLALTTAGIAAARGPWVWTATGTFTSANSVYAFDVTFSSRTNASGEVRGTVDYLQTDPTTGSAVRHVLGDGLCSVDEGNGFHWTLYQATNFGTSANPDTTLLMLGYVDGGRSGTDSWDVYVWDTGGAELCGLAPILSHNFFGLTSGDIRIR